MLSRLVPAGACRPVLCRKQCRHGGHAAFVHADLSSASVSSSRHVSCSAAGCPTSAEVARTITALVTYGTLSSLSEDGTPLGTYVTFVLDSAGLPVLRLRHDAVHTANLKRNPRCTLFAHAAERPAREVARVTLVGEVEAIGSEEAAEVAARHAFIYGSHAGVDGPRPDDIFMRLKVSECFYVAGLGEAKAESISAEDYCAAEPDELKDCAARLVHSYNTERVEDVLRIAAHQMNVQFEQMHAAEFVWIDTRGLYLRGETIEGVTQSLRYEFNRPALNELDVVSMITMASQVAWEVERNYTPNVPEAIDASKSS